MRRLKGMRRNLIALSSSLLVSVAILFPPLPVGADECPPQDQQDQVVIQGFHPAMGVIKLRQTPSQTPTPEEIVNHPGMDIRSAHWSVRAKPTVVEMGFDQQAIADFIGLRWLDSQGTIKDDRPMDFQWVKVDKEEGYLLLVLVPGWPRDSSDALHIYKSCTDIMKVWLQTISVAKLEDWNNILDQFDVRIPELSTLAEAVKDLNGDGTPELIIPTFLEKFRSFKPLWTTVYQWDEKRFADASAPFPDF